MSGFDFAIKSLDKVPLSDVTEAFLKAFADYGLTLDADSLKAMWRRRGAKMELSYGAFAPDDSLVSFIINGIGEHNGRTTAYDTGTGTVKEYRGLGLTDRIFSYCVDHLAEAGIETYLLEVLTDNIPAIKIYTRQGFEMKRVFDCFTADNSCVHSALHTIVDNPSVTIAKATVHDIEQCTSFMDFTPSWQNSYDSIKRNPDAFFCLVAYMGKGPVGMGISETAYGDISLIAVDPRYRRTGIGSMLMRELIDKNRLDKAKVLNVEHGCECLKEFLLRSGFQLNCSQYEMSKDLCKLSLNH